MRHGLGLAGAVVVALVTGCTNVREVRETAQPARLPVARQPLVVLKITDLPADGPTADPGYLGSGLQFLDLALIVPLALASDEFKSAVPRTTMLENSLESSLTLAGIPSETTKDASGPYQAAPFALSVTVRQFDIDTSLSFLFPLILNNMFAFDHRVATVTMDASLTQAGRGEVWRGRVTGSGKDDYDADAALATALRTAAANLIKQSGVERAASAFRSATFSQAIAQGKSAETDGNLDAAMRMYMQAFSCATTETEDLEAAKGMGRAVRAGWSDPSIYEDIRRNKVQADAAVDGKRFSDAANLYGATLAANPWWDAGHFNRSQILAELGDFSSAAREMKIYLALSPNASDARAAQDRVYEWEGKAAHP